EGCAAGACKHATAIIELGQALTFQVVALGQDPGMPDRFLSRIKAKQVPARDHFAEPSILNQGADVLFRHFASNAHRPPPAVPLTNGANRRLAVQNAAPNGLNCPTGAANRTRSGDHDSGGETHSTTSSGCRKARQLFEPPNPREFEIAPRI